MEELEEVLNKSQDSRKEGVPCKLENFSIHNEAILQRRN
jgi:hypothetical protein